MFPRVYRKKTLRESVDFLRYSFLESSYCAARLVESEVLILLGDSNYQQVLFLLENLIYIIELLQLPLATRTISQSVGL